MSTQVYKDLTTDTWLQVFASGMQLKYLHLLNMEASPANVALALLNTGVTELSKPTSLSALATGTIGGHLYQYYVTALNANGETDPSLVAEISNGTSYGALASGVNYHTLSWDAVSGATGYRLYCLIDGQMRIGKDILSGTSGVNEGDWDLYPDWPWMNTTQIVAFFLYEALPGHGILQNYMEVEIPSSHKVVLACDTSRVSVYAYGQPV